VHNGSHGKGRPLSRRRTHPTPASFTQEVEDIIDSLDDLIPLYAEMDEYVWDRRDSSTAVAGRISGGGKSDPTSATVSEQEGNKAQLRRVMHDLQRVKAIVDGTEKNEWQGIREKLLQIFDPPEHESLASFRSASGSGGTDRQTRALEGKVQRFATRLRKYERLMRRVG
jgi:hypothetical protein